MFAPAPQSTPAPALAPAPTPAPSEESLFGAELSVSIFVKEMTNFRLMFSFLYLIVLVVVFVW